MRPANDNKPKYVRGTFAEMIPAVWEYRNKPDSPPDPLQSSWNVDPSTVIHEQEIDDTGGVSEKFEEDLLLEITPSLKQIAHELAHGQVVRGDPETNDDGDPLSTVGPIVAIGKLKFSDGGNHERSHKRGPDGDVIAYMRRMPTGAMLGATEKVGGSHAGVSSNVTISNTHMVGAVLGWVLDKEGNPTDVPVGYRPYSPATRKRRHGKSLSPAASKANLALAIANTAVMPTVTKCPPGMACGTAQYSDQFIGYKIGSTGKGGAPSWVDFYMAMRDHEEWVGVVSDVEEKHVRVLDAALTARSLKDVGVAAGQTPKYAVYDKGGKRALVAANDNLVASKNKNRA